MSYQVLARKWRPRFFDEMVGQEHVLKALINALDNDRLHHAYLFTGTRGVGKTTIARVLAKCLNCEQGVSSKPCGECSACVSIDEGRFVDLIEVDAASRAKVDETRELMDNVQYAPSVGRFKVYLIDEVHMFSNHSFNALLKTLEEPPPHVKFLLATTESKKVPVTILSRCLQFNLKHISAEQIEKQIKHILKNEKVEFDDAACRLISKSANGSLRDGLSLLDQAIAYGGGKLEQAQVQTMLGTIDSDELTGLLSDLFSGNAQAVLEKVELLAEHNPDFDLVMNEMLSMFQQIALLQIVTDENNELSELASQTDKEQVQLFYQIALTGRRDLALAPEPRMGFEMTLIRMLAFQPQENLPPGTVVKKTAPAKNDTPSHAKTEKKFTTTSETISEATSTPDVKNVSHESVTDIKTLPTNDWASMIDELSLTGLVKELAAHCVLKEQGANKIELLLSSEQEHLLNTNQKNRLQEAIKKQFGDTMKLLITVQDADTETPAQHRKRLDQEQQLAAENSIAGDPNISALKEVFGATVDNDSIQPVKNVK